RLPGAAGRVSDGQPRHAGHQLDGRRRAASVGDRPPGIRSDVIRLVGRKPSWWRLPPALVVIAVLFAAPLLAPFSPYVPVALPLTPPGGPYLLGTNELGQDTLSVWLYAARSSMVSVVGVVAISTALAWTCGIAAGVWRTLEGPVLGLADLLLALP